MVGHTLVKRDSLRILVKLSIEIRGILVALVGSPIQDKWVTKVHW